CAGQDLHQRRLSGAVFANQYVDGTAANFEVHILQGDGAWKDLTDPFGFEDDLVVGGRGSAHVFPPFADLDRIGEGREDMSASTSADNEIILKAEGVGKIFPGTVALQDVDFEVRRGAVNVLVGENGAGKSTLMKILAGAIEPTTGRLLLRGEPVVFQSVRDAARQGIGIIYQELNLCPNLSVAENLSLIDPPTRFGFDIDRARQTEKARKLLARMEQPIEPNALAEDLRIGQQQIVEIAKALAADV